MICDKVFECTEHSSDLNPSIISCVRSMATHDSTVNDLLQEFSGEVFNHHPPYSSDLAPSDFHLFLHLKKFLSDQQQLFQNDREEENECHGGSTPSGRLLRHRDTKVDPTV